MIVDSETGRERLDVSIIIPCYFEEAHLERNVLEVERTMKSTIWSFEIIFVEDGSSDGTPGIVRDLISEGGNRRAIFHDANMGRGAAVMTGLRAAKGKVAGFIDIDLEVPSLYIPEAISHILNLDYELVVGRRTYKIHLNPSDLFRHAMSDVYRRISHFLLPVPISDSEAGFKFFLTDKVVPLLDTAQYPGWFWDTEIVLLCRAGGLRIGEFDCLFVRRSDKESTVDPLKDSWESLKSILEYRKKIAGAR